MQLICFLRVHVFSISYNACTLIVVWLSSVSSTFPKHPTAAGNIRPLHLAPSSVHPRVKKLIRCDECKYFMNHSLNRCFFSDLCVWIVLYSHSCNPVSVLAFCSSGASNDRKGSFGNRSHMLLLFALNPHGGELMSPVLFIIL